MKYCQECGSEIGETVTFCPYCGISQKPAQAAEEPEQDKTIAVNQW
ncbi:MAG TPA: zinc-ribbon domain-containing protein [Pyrinomonadaceae bacterium]|nr:zinc-ribbon domain-containing protein [Pyrinomonadaceae bacterium]